MTPKKLALFPNSLILFALAVSLFASPVRAEPQATFTVTASNDVVDATPGDGVCETATGNGMCTLRAAIMEANAHIGEDIIELPAATYELTIPGANEDLGASGDLDITESLTIIGAGSANAVIDADGLGDRVLEIRHNAEEVTISGVKIQKGTVTGGGGGILTVASLTLSDVHLYQNQAFNAWGGAIYSTAPLTLTHVTVENNHSEIGGGGITFGLDNLYIEDSQFINNRADENGGALLVSIGANVHIVRSDFSMNRAVENGGAIYMNSELEMEDSTIRNGEADNAGGGIYIGENATATLTNVSLTSNSANLGGGILIMVDGNLTGSHLLFDSNSAIGQGGAINGNEGSAHLSQSVFRSNTADRGGAIMCIEVHYQCTISIESSTIISNTANTYGGGINNNGTVILDGVTLNANRAENGGGVSNFGALRIQNSTISGNSAKGDGGGIIAGVYSVSIYNSTVTHNTAGTDLLHPGGAGGGVYAIEGSEIQFKNTILAGNHHRQLLNFIDDDCYGTLQSGDYNLVGTLSNCTISDPPGHDLIGEDPSLGELADNGGSTQTHALLEGSPAIDGANPAGCLGIGDALLTSDQRGVARPLDGDGDGSAYCDIGAYEVSRYTSVYLPFAVK